MMTILLIIIGLCLFETISSVDNAVINADVLHTMSPKMRKWFLFWGIIFAVVVVRGLLPLIIVWFSSPGLNLWQAFSATFSNDPQVKEIVETSKPVLLSGGGIFLLFLFLHWLFVEKKEYSFFLEKIIHRHSLWFYSFISILLTVIAWLAIKINPYIALSAIIGSTAFFITTGFKENAEKKEQELLHDSHIADWSKILYLELIDATFSIDGVLGAFAFTTSIPLILIGNGLGAFVVRYITVKGVHTVRKYRYLKNGAMYSVGFLGIVMLLASFGRHVPEWFTPIVTISLIAFFFWLSYREVKQMEGLK